MSELIYKWKLRRSQIKEELNGSVSIRMYLGRLTIRKLLKNGKPEANWISVKIGSYRVTSHQIFHHFELMGPSFRQLSQNGSYIYYRGTWVA